MMPQSPQPAIATDDPAFVGLKIVYRPAVELVPYANNARTHDATQIQQIKASFLQFGFTNPVLLDGENGILAGHGRTVAALELYEAGDTIRMCPPGMVPTLDLGHLTKTEQRAYIIADNRLAENAGWDYGLLKIELGDLLEEGFDLDLLGFGDTLAELLAPEATAGETDEDEVPPVPEDPVSVEGDVWLLGRHRLICGDSTNGDAVLRLMAGHRADLLHTDPPYGVSYTGGGEKAWTEIKNDALADDSLVDFLYEAFASAVVACKPGVPWYIWHADVTTAEFVKALNMADRKLSAHIIWVKNQMGAGWGDYRSKHEPCIYSGGGKNAWYGGRDKSTVWNVDRELNYVHPTQKPVELVLRALENSSKPGDAVLDLFGGSGSTLIAAEKSGRNAFLIELSPNYVDTIVLRWQAFTGKSATLEEDGRTFTEVLAERKPHAVLVQSEPAAKPARKKKEKAPS